jgi:glycerol kinase
MDLLLGLDQGTSGTKAYLMTVSGERAGLGYVPLERLHPHPGWTEQDPQVVAAGAARAIELALAEAGAGPDSVIAAGIASQRDTDFVWDARTGRPLGNAITWQDLRTTSLVEELDGWDLARDLRYRLGYYPGPWCAAMHLSWRMHHQPEFRSAVEASRARIGMSAGWLLTVLGTPSDHVHDYALVQKTGLWDFREGRYWSQWIERLGLRQAGLPAPVPTLYPFGALRIGDVEVPVVAMAGDQQAALFGHNCRQPGEAECTHGTVSFVDVVAGAIPPELDCLNVYHAWSLPTSGLSTVSHTYCLEADTAASGAAVRWLVNQAGLLEAEGALDQVARQVTDAGGVTFVPAFSGLNVPYDDHAARAAIVGMTLGVGRAHIVRALLEAIAYQVRAILDTIASSTGLRVTRLNVGGGVSASDVACQTQADILGLPVLRPSERETTARGAALLAGLGAGVWQNLDDLPPLPPGGTIFEPHWPQDRRDEGYARWQAVVAQVRELGAA